MARIFLVDLEAVETRYTGQWKHHLPALLKRNGHEVTVIEGPADIPSATTPGAFLNFGGTNIYKSVQVERLARLFTEGRIAAGDHCIFTDAWHPGIINLKYMSELLGIPVTIHALWHAGSYDPQDFLGRLIGDAAWVRHSEKAFYHAIDHNYFATDFHIELFVRELLNGGYQNENPWYEEELDEILSGQFPKIVRTGWPMEYMPDTLSMYQGMDKRDLILFPHRIAPEKQVEIFRDLKEQLPQYEFVVCQDQQLTKNEYHNLLGEAKLVFSANLQETLGISMYEGAIVNAIPMVPDRLSYSEMFADTWKYPSDWTSSWDSYVAHRKELCDKIVDYMENYRNYSKFIPQQAHSLNEHFFSCKTLLDVLK
jgi:glycosyltransferase involved in cell wall biosynthesis